ncbi:MAG: hypothetical protein OEZ22_01965 [Spirochaetia bacterium]|nr:hypothetical protein [Spirochaetia bacterium]
MNWEEKIYEAAVSTLVQGFAVYDFNVSYTNGTAKILVSLDKLDDPHGSPNIEDCERFSRLFQLKLSTVSELEDSPLHYTIEVSSPGAEREIKMPEELERFKDLPMKVEYNQEGKRLSYIYSFIKIEKNITYWKIADVKRNRKENLLKKNNEEKQISLNDIYKVSLFVDF